MLRVTKLTDYATVLLACLAKAPHAVHSASDLAEQAKLELPTVSKVLKPLSRAGLVEAFRGSQGGYRLAKPAAQISLYAVVEAMEGHPGMTECSGEHSSCEHETHCGVRSKWLRINDVVADALRGVSLAEMMPAVTVPLKPKGLPTAKTQSPTRALRSSPNFTLGRGGAPSILSSATSVGSSWPTIRALNLRPSPNRTSTVVEPWMT